MIVDQRKPRPSKNPVARATNQEVDLVGGGSQFGILGSNSNEILETEF